MSTLLRQNRSIAWRAVDDESVLIDPSNGTVFVLNAVGAQLWSLLEEPRTRVELVGTVAETYAISRERAATDVDAFLDALGTRRLVEEAGMQDASVDGARTEDAW